MLRQRKDCQDKFPLPFSLIIVMTELRVSSQSSFHSSSVMSQQSTLCRNRDSISALSSAWTLLRHIAAGCDIVLLVCLKFCHDKHKLFFDIECCNCHFLLLFCWNYLIFQLKPAKHKVDEYSIILHKNRFEIAKNMPEKWIKNR